MLQIDSRHTHIIRAFSSSASTKADSGTKTKEKRNIRTPKEAPVCLGGTKLLQVAAMMVAILVLLFPFAVSSVAVPGNFPVLKYESKMISSSAWVSLGTFAGAGSFRTCSAR